MKAVVLAAGPSERLKPFTETRAKPMIQVAGRPILEVMTLAMKAAGITEILIVVNHKRETIQSYFERGAHLGLSIDYVLQERLDGIGSALMRCRKALGDEPFLLVYGDVLATGPLFQQVQKQYLDHGGSVAALSLPPSSQEFGNVYLDPEMRIVRLLEKPKDPHLSNYVFAGVFVLHPAVFRLLDQCDNDIEQVYQALIAERSLQGVLWDGGWIDITRPWHILEANRLLMEQWHQAEVHQSVLLEGAVQIEGAVHIEANVVVGAGSVLKGPCYIGEGSYIGNHNLIREYSALGRGSVVGYGCELKNCVLFGKAQLGRLSFIGDSVIGQGTRIGTGVTTVNLHLDERTIEMETEEGAVPTGLRKVGAFIGDDVVIGARHVLGPGTRIRSGARIDNLITLRSIL